MALKCPRCKVTFYSHMICPNCGYTPWWVGLLLVAALVAVGLAIAYLILQSNPR